MNIAHKVMVFGCLLLYTGCSFGIVVPALRLLASGPLLAGAYCMLPELKKECENLKLPIHTEKAVEHEELSIDLAAIDIHDVDALKETSKSTYRYLTSRYGAYQKLITKAALTAVLGGLGMRFGIRAIF